MTMPLPPMARPPVMLRRWMTLLAFVTGLAAALPARASLDYTDLWWNAAESGWGVNLVQSDAFIFATFFIYDGAGQPAWVSAQLTRKPDGAWSGPLYKTEGTTFNQPWNPADSRAIEAGTATFTPSGTSGGTLVYSIDGVTVTKAVTRQTLTPIPLDGIYSALSEVVTTDCTNPASDLREEVPTFVVVTTANGSMQIAVHVPETFFLPPALGAAFLTATGTPLQQGRLSRINNATMTLKLSEASPVAYTGRVSQLRRTELGLTAVVTGTGADGCTLNVAITGIHLDP